jgi:hypothetical protein
MDLHGTRSVTDPARQIECVRQPIYERSEAHALDAPTDTPASRLALHAQPQTGLIVELPLARSDGIPTLTRPYVRSRTDEQVSIAEA